jgi:Uncharacterized conserved protein
MKSLRKLFVSSIALLLFSAFSLWSNMDWKIENHPIISFEGTKVKGHFKEIKGTLSFDPNQLDKANFTFEIPVNSIETGKSLMNKHAISADWLNADQFPIIHFQSTQFEKNDSIFLVKGNLSLHGVTKEIRIPFTFAMQTFTADFEIRRSDYGVGSSKGMAEAVAPTLRLHVEIPVQPQPQVPAVE